MSVTGNLSMDGVRCASASISVSVMLKPRRSFVQQHRLLICSWVLTVLRKHLVTSLASHFATSAFSFLASLLRQARLDIVG